MTGIQRLLPIFVEAKGYYLLPAVAGALVLARYLLSRAGHERHKRGLLVALAATAAFSVPVYFNFFNYHFGGFVNPHEFFHYYLGSKYTEEIGYFDLYNAALVADDETGLAFRPVDGHILDLSTYGYRTVASVLAERDRIKSRFTTERWREWVKDVSYFKRRLRGQQWNELLRDQGYNATPVWSMLVGTGLSGRIATDNASGMTFLALLDVLLLSAAVSCVAWAFGAWPALLMIVFLASSYLMAHVHMKGAFLRTDFVVALVAAMCLLRKGRHAWAGALVGYSTLARVFPAIFLFGPGVKLATELVPVAREASRRVGGWAAALVAAHAAAGSILLVLSWLAIGSGLREVVTSRLGAASSLFLLAIVPATAGLTALTLAIWGTSRNLLDRRHLRFFGGFALTTAVLTLASIVNSGGMGGWEGFARKMAIHRTTYNHWNIGVTSVVIAQFDPPGPREAALAARPPFLRGWLGNAYFFNETVSEKAWLIRFLQLIALAAAWFAARRSDDASAFAFGFVLTYFLTAPTYYYYIILLVPFLFFATHPDRLRGTLGLIYLFLFGALGFTFYFRWDQYFTTYYWNSVLACGVTIAMTAAAFGRFAPAAAVKGGPRKR
jgi:hypothetical protein